MCVRERKRSVTFCVTNKSEKACLLAAVNKTFQDVGIYFGNDAIVQIKSETWGGEFLDVAEEDVIPDRAVIQVLEAVSNFRNLYIPLWARVWGGGRVAAEKRREI